MRTLISRFVSPFVTASGVWLSGKGIEQATDAEWVSAATELGTLLLIAGFVSASGVIHKLMDRKVNPSDTAV